MDEKTQIITPAGELYWVNITGQGKHNKEFDTYKYSATLRFKTDEDYENFASIEARMAKALKLKPGWKTMLGEETELMDGDDGEKIWVPTDKKIVRFTTNTTFKQSNDQVVVRLFDSTATAIDPTKYQIGNGSVGKLKGTLAYYKRGTNYGFAYYLSAIQLLTLKKVVDFEPAEGDFKADKLGQGDLDDIAF